MPVNLPADIEKTPKAPRLRNVWLGSEAFILTPEPQQKLFMKPGGKMNLITEWANSPRGKDSQTFVSERLELKLLKAQPRAEWKNRKRREPTRNRGERSIQSLPLEVLTPGVESTVHPRPGNRRWVPAQPPGASPSPLFLRPPHPAAATLSENFPLG